MIAIVISLPVFYWNYQHDWISFHYQTNHVLAHRSWSPFKFLQAQLLQFVVYSPALYLLGIISIFRRSHWANPALRLLLIASVIVLLFFAYGAGYTVSLPHWPALAWVATHSCECGLYL